MSILWILGEAKSGKSELAEEIFARLPGSKFYIGTLPRTPQWMETIAKHAARRPKTWKLIEISNSLESAREEISYHKGPTAVLLDGWGVYARERATHWPGSPADEERFVKELFGEYQALCQACDHLVVVAHISAMPPTPTEYAQDRITARVRAITSRCLQEADLVIYHDREDVSHQDVDYVESVVSKMRQEEWP